MTKPPGSFISEITIANSAEKVNEPLHCPQFFGMMINRQKDKLQFVWQAMPANAEFRMQNAE